MKAKTKLSEETKQRLKPLLEVLATAAGAGLDELGTGPLIRSAKQRVRSLLVDDGATLLEKAGFGDQVETLTQTMTGHADFGNS